MRIGEIYWVNLDPTIADEIKKKRPVVILNTGHRTHLKLAIVVPVTGWNPHWDNNPFFVRQEPSESNGLKKRSMIDCFQIRAISHKRLAAKIGDISQDEIDLIKNAVSLILDIDPEHCK